MSGAGTPSPAPGSPAEHFTLEETFDEPVIERIRDWTLARTDRTGR